MKFDSKRIADLRALRGQGVVSAVGEYTPDEFWEALDEIERLTVYEQYSMLSATREELHEICDATVRLTEIRQRGCAHLCVENLAPQIMRKLLLELQMHKRGMVQSEDIWSTGGGSLTYDTDNPNITETDRANA